MTSALDRSSRFSRDRLRSLIADELARFKTSHPRAAQSHRQRDTGLFGGVPMPWMMRWAGGFPVIATRAEGAHLEDLDGHRYVDFCLGDTGAMTGHAPPAVVAAASARLANGTTMMLPTDDAGAVGRQLRERFGLPYWLITLSATDANRHAIRFARQATRRTKVICCSFSYHGSVDETLAVTAPHETTVPRPGNVGAPIDVAETTRAIEFNDIDGLRRALGHGDAACVLLEPAMTNMGIVQPLPGYHSELRRLTRDAGVLLIIDETHTFSAGPGGLTAELGLEPDILTIGKAIGGGVPAGALGLTEPLAQRLLKDPDADLDDTGGIGGTLAGNALTLAAMRATLEEVLTDDAFAHATAMGARLLAGVNATIADHSLPWHALRIGARVEYRFVATPPPDGTSAQACTHPLLEQYLHLHALNRGVLITPFHNMLLACPATSSSDVDRHTEVFEEALAGLLV